jgi:hypothetical protein
VRRPSVSVRLGIRWGIRPVSVLYLLGAVAAAPKGSHRAGLGTNAQDEVQERNALP